jgi:hypothetical protein
VGEVRELFYHFMAEITNCPEASTGLEMLSS